MAVQKSRKSHSRKGMKRAHQALRNPALSTDPETGKIHRRHHVTDDGYYRGKQVIRIKLPHSKDEHTHDEAAE